MDSTKIVKLISEDITHGNYGQEMISESAKEVFGSLASVTRNEWTTAGQRGVEASFRLDVYTFEYSGEEIVEVDGVRYGVYRSYIRIGEDITELYLHTMEGVTYCEDDDIPEDELSTYVTVFNALSASGIPVFYAHASKGQKMPFIVYELDSDNFDADNRVYANGYTLTARLYTGRKSVKRERMLEDALNEAEIPWERGETDDLDERVYVQEYIGPVLGGD